MVGLMQIMIYLLCIYLVYKGVEIFQIAFVSDSQKVSRIFGLILGILMMIGAVVVGIGTVIATESMVLSLGQIGNVPGR